MYIYEQKDWPAFTWDLEKIFPHFSEAVYLHGNLIGMMENLSLDAQEESDFLIQANSIISSSAIEGEVLDPLKVRSSIARQRSLPYVENPVIDHHIDSVVAMSLDATQHPSQPLTLERLFSWHRALFPAGYSGLTPISTGALRTDRQGRMQVISRSFGPTPIIHYEAPLAIELEQHIQQFLSWINQEKIERPFFTAAIAHLWVLTLHPFEDGNGRIGRAIVDYILTRSERTQWRFYSISSQINDEKQAYYAALERTQKGTLDITEWIIWFVGCLSRSMVSAREIVEQVLRRERFYQRAAPYSLTPNQHIVIAKFLDNFEGKLTSSKYAKICKVSQDTATRELKDLCEKGLFRQEGDGRSTHYVL
jgi:Fic family protein